MATYTTITINSNVLSTLENHPKELIKNLIQTCDGYYYRIGQDSFKLGVDVPYIKVQKPREYLETTVFVYSNGELLEMNPNSPLTSELKVVDINTYNNLLDILQYTVSELAGEVRQLTNVNDQGQEIIFETTEAEELINSGEKITPEGFFVDDLLITKWLKDNKIPTTVAKLKKLKTIKK